MNHKTIALGCPWRVLSRGDWHCKALIDQPNGSRCVRHNCAAAHILAFLFIEEGDKHENATSTTASTGRNKS